MSANSCLYVFMSLYVCGLSWWLSGKVSTCQLKRRCFSLWVGKIPWRRKWHPTLWYLCLGNPMDRGAWHPTVLEVTRVRHDLATQQEQFVCMLLLFSHQSCLTLYDSMDCSMPGFPVPLHLFQFAQVHDHWISDAIQPSHPLLLSCPSAFNLSQHQSLFQWIGSLNQVTKILQFQASVLPMSIQGWFPLELTVLISCCPKDTPESSPAPQFESIHSSLLCFFFMIQLTFVHDYWKDHSLDYMDLFQQSDVFAF